MNKSNFSSLWLPVQHTHTEQTSSRESHESRSETTKVFTSGPERVADEQASIWSGTLNFYHAPPAEQLSALRALTDSLQRARDTARTAAGVVTTPPPSYDLHRLSSASDKLERSADSDVARPFFISKLTPVILSFQLFNRLAEQNLTYNHLRDFVCDLEKESRSRIDTKNKPVCYGKIDHHALYVVRIDALVSQIISRKGHKSHLLPAIGTTIAFALNKQYENYGEKLLPAFEKQTRSAAAAARSNFPGWSYPRSEERATRVVGSERGYSPDSSRKHRYEESGSSRSTFASDRDGSPNRPKKYRREESASSTSNAARKLLSCRTREVRHLGFGEFHFDLAKKSLKYSDVIGLMAQFGERMVYSAQLSHHEATMLCIALAENFSWPLSFALIREMGLALRANRRPDLSLNDLKESVYVLDRWFPRLSVIDMPEADRMRFFGNPQCAAFFEELTRYAEQAPSSGRSKKLMSEEIKGLTDMVLADISSKVNWNFGSSKTRTAEKAKEATFEPSSLSAPSAPGSGAYAPDAPAASQQNSRFKEPRRAVAYDFF